MANTVTEWKSGQNPTPGVESVGYPNCDFTWNVGSGTDHAEVLSEPFAYPGRYFTILVNTNGASISTSTTMAYTLYGSNDADLTHSMWDTIVTGSLTNAEIDDEIGIVKYAAETNGSTLGFGIYKFYKLGLDPNQDPGVDYAIKVGINAPPIGSDA